MKLVDYLNSLDENTLMLVEGKKDALALKKLGVRARVFQVSSERDISRIACELQEKGNKNKMIVVMPDFDRKGKEKYQRWTKTLRGVANVDYFTWKKLRVLVARNTKDIEGFPKMIEKVRYQL